MTIGELKELIDLWDNDMNVYLASDPEGNSYHPVHEIEIDTFDEDALEAIHPDDISDDEGVTEAAIIWP